MSQSLLKIVADFTVQLSSSVAIGDTTATLSSATDDDSVSLPSGLYGFTVDNGQSNKEYIVCSLSGTALTDIKSISRQGVQTTGFTKAHRRGAKVSITDWAILDRMLKNLNGTTGFDSSVNLGYDGTPTGLTGNQFATVNYVLSVVNGGTITFDKQVIDNQTAGENLTANDIIYFKESDQKWYKADADLTTTFDQLQIGIAQSTVLTGATVQVAISGPVSGFTGLTAGSKYYLSNTAGAITTTAGTYSVFIGWALSTTSLLFNPVLKTLPTQKEKDALAGSTGIPSSTNKFLTQDNILNSTTDQTQTTQNGTVELGEANAATKKNKIAQSFIPTKTKIRGVNLYKSADLGTFTGTVTVSLQADSSGSPSGSALATTTISNANYLVLPVGEFEVIFTTEYSGLVVGNLYWIVIETSTSDSSNHPNIGTNTAGGYANGSVKYNNSTDGWTAISTIDLYFKTLQGIVNQVGQSPIVQTFLNNGVWVKPIATLPFKVLVECWGGGGSGAKHITYGSGGGGGAYNQAWIDSSQLNTTETIIIGTGGAAVTSASTNGNPGGNTSFGSKVIAYGGGGGGANGSGGGGGGVLSAGSIGQGGQPSTDVAGGFGSASTTAPGGPNAFGGGGGGGSTSSTAGGSSYYGGGGGGSGGSGGGTGGSSQYGGGGGGNASPSAGGTSIFGGSGGGGSSSGTATSGSFPSGGGGGTATGTSGAGGAGKVVVTIFM